MEERQLALQAVMRQSDAHASKCAKLGLSFKKEYPDEYAEYEKAREEYNANEEELPKLREQLSKEAEELREQYYKELSDEGR